MLIRVKYKKRRTGQTHWYHLTYITTIHKEKKDAFDRNMKNMVTMAANQHTSLSFRPGKPGGDWHEHEHELEHTSIGKEDGQGGPG